MKKEQMQNELGKALPEPPSGLLLIVGADGVKRAAGVEVSAEEEAAWLANPAHVTFTMPDNGRDPEPAGEGEPQPIGDEPPALPRVLPHVGKVILRSGRAR